MNRRQLRSFYLVLGVLIPAVLFLVGSAEEHSQVGSISRDSLRQGALLAGQFMLGAAFMLTVYLVGIYRKPPWLRHKRITSRQVACASIAQSWQRTLSGWFFTVQCIARGSFRRLPGKIAVIVVYFNPTASGLYKSNYSRTLHSLAFWDVDVFRIEIVFPGDPLETKDAFLSFKAEDRNRVWQHERVINKAVQQLPQEYDKVAIVDPGLLLLGNKWLRRAKRSVSRYPAVHLFSNLLRVESWGRVSEVLRSVTPSGCGDEAANVLRLKMREASVWALMLRRELFPLYERFGSFRGLTVLLDSLGSQGNSSQREWMSPRLADDFSNWAAQRAALFKGGLGCIQGDAVQLSEREEPCVRMSCANRPLVGKPYDPTRDIEEDAHSGLLAVSHLCTADMRTHLSDESVSSMVRGQLEPGCAPSDVPAFRVR